jgi:glycosyltransferase involved in cell wall biosynthesis
MLPLGVVIPTKNSMPYLPAHLEGLRAWQDLAREIIVVDSFSNDGSVDFIKARLDHPCVRFLKHPPGLYQSWNHGISQVTQPYFYLATTGDTITRAGIEKLVGAAESLAADVTISKPEFATRDGTATENIHWPIDDIIATLGVTAPRKLSHLEAVVFAVAHATGAMLGSSASNLYRTETFQRLPFPTDFGTGGDGAWGRLHAAEVTWAVVPEKFSTFLIHPTNASVEEKHSWLEARRPDAVLRAGMEAWRRGGIISDQDLLDLGWEDLLGALTSHLDAKVAFDQTRRGPVPWVLNPRAWRNRMARSGASGRLRQLKEQALLRCSLPVAGRLG